jgi:hypothetical protein
MITSSGAVIGAGQSSVGDECPRARDVKKIKHFVRLQDVVIDPAICLLEQGVLCNGIATRPSRVIVFAGADLEKLMSDDHFSCLLMKKIAQVIGQRLKDTRIQLLSLLTQPIA